MLGASRFLMSHTSKTRYPHEIKLAAVKARIEEQLSSTEIMARHGVTRKLLQHWCKLYREHGEAGLLPKKKGRPVKAKHKPPLELLSPLGFFSVGHFREKFRRTFYPHTLPFYDVLCCFTTVRFVAARFV